MNIGRATGGVSAVGKPGTAHQFQRRELVAVPVLRRTHESGIFERVPGLRYPARPPPRHEKIMDMRFRLRFRQMGAVLVLCLAATAQTSTLTMDQLMKFLTSSVELKMSDMDVAKYLAKTRLSERLDDTVIEKLLASGIGPKTLDALRALRDKSEALATAKPVVEAPKVHLPPAPDAVEQAEIIGDAREDALNYSKSLPNFLTTQVVRRYQAGAPGSRYNRSSSEPSWVPLDTLTLRLSYFDQKEEYKLIMHGNSPTSQD